jgi:glycosyltransferase involved in cell wall biosynthesis
MKVLQIIDKLEVGGAERVFVDLTNLLYESKKVEVSILTFDAKGKLFFFLNKKIAKINFKRENRFNVFTAYKLSKLLKSYDILHVHMRHPYRYVKIVCLIFGVKTKLVFQDHYGEISIDKSIPKFFNTFLKPKYYIGVSSELTNWAKNTLQVNHVFKLSNIIIKEKIVPRLNEKEGFVIVGNIKPVKNQLFAIQLAASLHKELTIIGEIHDHKYYEIIIKEIESLNCKNQVQFLHGIDNVQKLLPKFELGLMTSISESGPLVLIEYLSQNLPFIANETGEVSAVLKKELPNLFINNFDLNEWRDKIKKLENKNLQLNQLYSKYYSPNQYIKECLKIYRSVKNS